MKRVILSRAARDRPKIKFAIVTSRKLGLHAMQDEWIIVLADGRQVKFTYQELPSDVAFVTAQVAGNEIVYSIVLAQVKKTLKREEVEHRFEVELAKK
jgi:hypothetical protein